MPAKKAAEATVQVSIGSRLRQLRGNAALTLAGLAGRSGISASTLSKIENNKVSPTFANLLRLAEAFGISLSRLIGEVDAAAPPPSTARIAVTRAADINFTRTQTYDMGPLCAELRNKRMSPFLDHVRGSDTNVGDRLVRHKGEEFVYVLAGELEIHTEHYQPIVLKEGDSAYFDSQMAHAFRAGGEEPAKMLMVWLPPEGRGSEEGAQLIRTITQLEAAGAGASAETGEPA